MKFFAIMLAAIWAWITKWFERPYQLECVASEYPPKLKPRTLYVLTEDDEHWEARMMCPCGCGDKLDLNLLTDARPAWHAWAGRNREANLRPSVWRHIGCKSHFVLRDGKITWC